MAFGGSGPHANHGPLGSEWRDAEGTADGIVGWGGPSNASRSEEAGWSVSPFDLAEGLDLRDFGAVLEGMRGCEQVVHAGAIAHDSAGSPDEIVTTNVLGTWHVLLAAEQLGVSKVVYFSSGQVFGFAEGEGQPAYLPVDDDHPTRASRPYGCPSGSRKRCVRPGRKEPASRRSCFGP